MHIYLAKTKNTLVLLHSRKFIPQHQVPLLLQRIRIKDKGIDFRKQLENGLKGQISITDEQMSTIHSVITGEGGHK